MMPKPLMDLLNKTDEGWHVFAFAIMFRTLRIVRDTSYRTFRVERLRMSDTNPHNPRGMWQTISSHTGQAEGEMYQSARDRLHAEQKRMYQKKAAKMKRKPGLVLS